MSHPDVKLVNILLSTTRVSLVQNKFVFYQLRVHYNFVRLCGSAHLAVKYRCLQEKRFPILCMGEQNMMPCTMNRFLLSWTSSPKKSLTDWEQVNSRITIASLCYSEFAKTTLL